MIGRLRRTDDGATLIIVLVIVVAIAGMLATLMTQVNTDERATSRGYRGQGYDTYAADAAGKAAITQIRNGSWSCPTNSNLTKSFGDGTTPFYSPGSGTQGALNATVICTSDGTSTVEPPPATGKGVQIDSSNLPDYVVQTMQPGGVIQGITLQDPPTGGASACFKNGDVISNSAIRINHNELRVRAACTTSGGTAFALKANTTCDAMPAFPLPPARPAGTFTGASCNSGYPASADPNIAAPAVTTPAPPVNPAPTCATSGGKTYAAFVPGVYTNGALLNYLTSCCPGYFPCSTTVDVQWFSPGNYYVDLNPLLTTVWSWAPKFIAGTPTTGDTVNTTGQAPSTPIVTGLSPTVASTLNKLSTATGCAKPSQQSTYPGVEFVLGGVTVMNPNPTSSSSSADLCASYSASGPPVLIYGTPTDLTVTGQTIHAQTFCTVLTTPCSATNPILVTPSFINATISSGYTRYAFNGYFYAPTAPINTPVFNTDSAKVLFGWGLTVWNLTLAPDSTAPGTTATAALPATNTGAYTVSYPVQYLTVFTCAASSTPCPTTGTGVTAQLRARVRTDGTAAKILTWAHTN